jgi:hypothetical protein
MTASNNASTSDTPFSSNVCETLNDEIWRMRMKQHDMAKSELAFSSPLHTSNNHPPNHHNSLPWTQR